MGTFLVILAVIFLVLALISTWNIIREHCNRTLCKIKGHEMEVINACVSVCKRCGMRQEQHDWDGCKCKRCGMENHDWVSYTSTLERRCSKCGKMILHDYVTVESGDYYTKEVCARCGDVFEH